MTERAHLSAAYTADRAAALAGVPVSTLYYWAKTGLVVPSVSSIKIKRWSYPDLLVLRLVEWLRRDKNADEVRLPRASMRKIRTELERAGDLGGELVERGLEVYADRAGGLRFGGPDGMYVHLGKGLVQGLVETTVDLVRPFEKHPGLKGPDLRQPRATLRIVPGKLAGEPHVEGTRIPTSMLRALDRRNFALAAIRDLYPSLSSDNVEEALDLEKQLERNAGQVAAA